MAAGDAYILNRETLAWAAGFFDGEGTFGRTTQHGRAPRVTIGQKDPDRLLKFQSVFPFARLYEFDTQRTTPQGTKYFGRFYQLKISGYERTQAVAAMLWPWLGPHKREQARSVLTGYAADADWATVAAGRRRQR